MNPLYPELPLFGHYGRDLTIAALSVLFRESVFEVQYAVTSLNQVAIAWLAYFLARRYVGRAPAALAVSLAFLGMRYTDFRFGLLEATGNNNSFAYLFLLLNAYLYMVAITRNDVATNIVSILSLATYSIVYETHFGVLLIVFSLFPIALMLRRWRWRFRYVGVAAAIVAGSLLLAVIEGGPLTDVGRRQLLRWQQARAQTAPADVVLTTQQVSVRFPKSQFSITASNGTEYSLFSRKLLAETGYSVVFLPGLAVVMFMTRCYWGLFMSMIAVVALLVPATVDFGPFNGESFRFLFFAGFAATMVLGIAVGMAVERMQGTRWRGPWVGTAAAVVAGLLCQHGIQRIVTDVREIVRYPEIYYWHAEEWACQSGERSHKGVIRKSCDELDARAAMVMRSLTKKGDTILTNVSNGPVTPYISSGKRTRLDVVAHSILSALSQAFVTGHGVRISKNGVYGMSVEYREARGFRAIAFWNTVDMTLLRSMSVTHLLVDPARLIGNTAAKIKGERDLELVDRLEDWRRGKVREIYRVRAPNANTMPPFPAPLSLVTVEPPAQLDPAGFYEIPFLLAVDDGGFDGAIDIGYRVFYRGLQMNINDEIHHVVTLTRVGGGGGGGGKLFLVAPYEPGEYEVELYAVHAGAWIPLHQPAGARATFVISVKEPQPTDLRISTVVR
jgi:hypothetical protein